MRIYFLFFILYFIVQKEVYTYCVKETYYVTAIGLNAGSKSCGSHNILLGKNANTLKPDDSCKLVLKFKDGTTYRHNIPCKDLDYSEIFKYL